MRKLSWCSAVAAAVTLFTPVLPAAADEGLSGAAVAEPEFVAKARGDCQSGNFCAWVDYEFSDGPGQWSGNAPDYVVWFHRSCGVGSLGTWTNCASSVFNNGQTCNLTFYDDTNYRGAYYNLPRGSYLARMTLDRMSDGGNANDRISSHRWCTF